MHLTEVRPGNALTVRARGDPHCSEALEGAGCNFGDFQMGWWSSRELVFTMIMVRSRRRSQLVEFLDGKETTISENL